MGTVVWAGLAAAIRGIVEGGVTAAALPCELAVGVVRGRGVSSSVSARSLLVWPVGLHTALVGQRVWGGEGATDVRRHILARGTGLVGHTVLLRDLYLCRVEVDDLLRPVPERDHIGVVGLDGLVQVHCIVLNGRGKQQADTLLGVDATPEIR